jgi:hypothetical protein
VPSRSVMVDDFGGSEHQGAWRPSVMRAKKEHKMSLGIKTTVLQRVAHFDGGS